MHTLRTFALCLLVLLKLISPRVAYGDDMKVWNGVVMLPGAQKLAFVLRIKDAGSATLDIPSQGLNAGALEDVDIVLPRMSFVLKPKGAPDTAWAIFAVTIDDTGKAATGSMNQMGRRFEVTMLRADAAAAAQAARGQAERWKGRIDAPGQALDFELKLYRAAQPPEGTLSIAAQGVSDSELKDFAIDGPTLKFVFGTPQMQPTAHASFTITVDAEGKTGKGTMKQVGLDIPVTMSILNEGESVELNRPQHPKPPYPYEQREVLVISFDGAKLTGTLTIPEAAKFGPGPHPAVVMATGSGLQDRDETLLGHKPFLVIADHLTRHGIAVLRVDDRGWNGNFDPVGARATTETFAKDAAAAVAFVREQPGIDPARVGIVGHSEGGVIAPMVAAEDPKLAFIVMLAGTGISGAEIVRLQTVYLAAARDPAADNPESRKHAAELAAALIREAEADELRTILKALTQAQLAHRADQITPEEQKAVDEQMETALPQLTSAWLRYFAKLDPADALRKVRCPVLAINGSLDKQVDAKANLEGVRKALAAGHKPPAKIEELAGLNHLFQPAKTGGMEEYALIETTFDPAALELISTWIRGATGLDGKGR